jgi:hypothetical protein
VAAIDPDLVRAAKLSRVPGVTIAEACERFGVTRGAILRARRTIPSLTLDDLLLAALTDNGSATTGKLSLEPIASWLDYVNHGCTVAEVQQMLDAAIARGQLAVDGNRWTLLVPWP